MPSLVFRVSRVALAAAVVLAAVFAAAAVARAVSRALCPARFGRRFERLGTCTPGLRKDCARLECETAGDVASPTRQCGHCGPCATPGAARCSTSMRAYCSRAQCTTSGAMSRPQCRGCAPCVAPGSANAPPAAAAPAAAPRPAAPVAAAPRPAAPVAAAPRPAAPVAAPRPAASNFVRLTPEQAKAFDLRTQGTGEGKYAHPKGPGTPRTYSVVLERTAAYKGPTGLPARMSYTVTVSSIRQALETLEKYQQITPGANNNLPYAELIAANQYMRQNYPGGLLYQTDLVNRTERIYRQGESAVRFTVAEGGQALEDPGPLAEPVPEPQPEPEPAPQESGAQQAEEVPVFDEEEFDEDFEFF